MTLHAQTAVARDHGGAENDLAGQLIKSAPKAIPTRLQEPSTLPDLWTYQGTEEVGRYYSGPDGFGAFAADGEYLGTFVSLTVARAVVYQHHVDAGLDRGRPAA